MRLRRTATRGKALGDDSCAGKTTHARGRMFDENILGEESRCKGQATLQPKRPIQGNSGLTEREIKPIPNGDYQERW